MAASTIFVLCLSLCVLTVRAMIVRRIVVPHDIGVGFTITSTTYLGQDYDLEVPETIKEIRDFFTMTDTGDLITTNSIEKLVDQAFSLVIKNKFSSNSWRDPIHVQVQNSSDLIYFPKKTYKGHVQENLPSGTPVEGLGDIVLSYGNRPVKMLSFSLLNDDGAFQVKTDENKLGSVSIITKSPLDREKKSVYDLTLQAHDTETHESTTTNIKITIDDVNDNIPIFRQSSYSATIDQDTFPGTKVLTVEASDLDDDKLTYLEFSSLSGAKNQDQFELDPKTGVVKLSSKYPVAEPGLYHLKIAASDGKHISAPVDVKIKVDGILHFKAKPEKLNRQRRAILAEWSTSIPETSEEQVVLFTIPYSGNIADPVFSLKTPPLGDIFDVQTDGGVMLKPGKKLDYDAGVSGREVSFIVEVASQANPGNENDTIPIKVTVRDVNDENPRFINPIRPFLAAVKRETQVGSPVYRLQGFDPDQGSRLKYYKLNGGDNLFSVNADTGNVILDRDLVANDDGQEYSIFVEVQDDAANPKQKSNPEELKIKVGTRAPQFYKSSYKFSVPEQEQEYRLTDGDYDSVQAISFQNAALEYSLQTDSGAQSDVFTINSADGVIKTLAGQDYDDPNVPKTYNLVVVAKEKTAPQLTSSVTVEVSLTDKNDNPPVFDLAEYLVPGEIAEDTPIDTRIYTVKATDRDSGVNSDIEYSILPGKQAAFFKIKSVNNEGVIEVAETLNYDNKSDHTYRFTVQATDKGVPPYSARTDIRVRLKNVNDEPPEISPSTIYANIGENADGANFRVVVQASDPDGDQLSYAFSNPSDPSNPFSINSQTGVITLTGSIDNSLRSYNLNVTVTDDSSCCLPRGPRLSSMAFVVIEVLDQVNNKPSFDNCNTLAPSVIENGNQGIPVVTMTASDPDTGDNGIVKYSFVGANTKFAIDEDSGVITTLNSLDREDKPSWSITVRARDSGNPQLVAYCTVTIQVDDINDNAPVFDQDSYDVSITNEDNLGVKPNGTEVLRIRATDQDAGENATVTYSLIDHYRDPNFSKFKINTQTGSLTLNDDFNTRLIDRVRLRVRAQDGGSPPRSEVADVNILSNNNEVAPQWQNDQTSINVPENIRVSESITTFPFVAIIPGEANDIRYSLVNGKAVAENGFPAHFLDISNNTGNYLKITVYRSLDYEELKTYTLRLRASRSQNFNVFTELIVTVNVEDVNDEVPVFQDVQSTGQYIGYVEEEATTLDVSILQVRCIDGDTDPRFKRLTYRILPGPDSNDFSIDQNTGVIKPLRTFDREIKDQYFFEVEVDDGFPSALTPGNEPNKRRVTVEIQITDKNDQQPEFDKRLYEATVKEDASPQDLVITVTATDKDKVPDLRYSIIGNNTGNAFGVRPQTGAIFVQRQLDFETPPKVYYLRYRVFDGIFSDETTVKITLEDVNDNDPKFSQDVYDVRDIVENDSQGITGPGRKILTVTATDADVERQNNIEYSLDGIFATQANPFFAINSKSGEVFLKRPLDRDPPNGHPIYVINVLAKDEPQNPDDARTGFAEIRVHVVDVNDNDPSFVASTLTGGVEEGKIEQNFMCVVAEDNDAGQNAEVTYSWINSISSFSMEGTGPNKGCISTTDNKLDRETESVYKLTVRATDNGNPKRSSTATVTINIEDVNDEPPVFQKKLYEKDMYELTPVGSSVLSVLADDEDIISELSYTLSNTNYFRIETRLGSNIGIIYLHSKVEFEPIQNDPYIHLVVTVTDGRFQDTANITIRILDSNDETPIFVPTFKQIDVKEDEPKDKVVFTFTASDKDPGRNGQFSFSIDRGQDSDYLHKFGVKQVNDKAEIYIKKALDRELIKDNYERVVKVLAVDKGTPALTGSATLKVKLLDVNDNYPNFGINLNPPPRVYENENPDQFVVTINATDPDDASNGPPFTFYIPNQPARGEEQQIWSENGVDLFKFKFKNQPTTPPYGEGTIHSAKMFDREKQKMYYMPIFMEDSGTPVQGGIRLLPIEIGDVNDNPHGPGYKEITVYNFEGWDTSKFADIVIGRAYAADLDDWDQQKIYEFNNPEQAEKNFGLERTTGNITMKGGIKPGQYKIEVKVTDTEKGTKWSGTTAIATVVVNIKEITSEVVKISGSVRLTDITAEEFVDRKRKPGGATNEYEPSKYDLFRNLLATKLGTDPKNVEIFTVLNNPTKPRTIDVRYSAHGSPWYNASKTNGVLLQSKGDFEALGLKIAMVNIDECLQEVCESGCSNELIIENTPLLINTNGTSLVGVMSYVQANCVCAAKEFNSDVPVCGPDSCLNGGVCKPKLSNIGYDCDCPVGFDGPRCQQTKHSFKGKGWAWYNPLSQCADSKTSIEFATTAEEGLILYNGPLEEPTGEAVTDFIAIEIRNSRPVVWVDHGTGPATVSFGASMDPVNDGNWHKIDVYREGRTVRVVVDECRNMKVTETPGLPSTVDRSMCEASAETPGENKFVNVNAPLQLGGRSTTAYPTGLTAQGLDGCVKNMVHNGELYDLHIGNTGMHANSEDGCPQESCGVNAVDAADGVYGYCGEHGECIGTVGRPDNEYTCICHPGWRGDKCDIETLVVDMQNNSYIQWGFKPAYYSTMSKTVAEYQIRFRTRDSDGVLIDASGRDGAEYTILEIKDKHLEFRYDLGNLRQIVSLPYVDVSDGEWHVGKVRRFGKHVMLSLDGGEGKYFAENLGAGIAHNEMEIGQRALFAGAEVRGDTQQTTLYFDLSNSCFTDVRINGHYLPMSQNEDSASKAASLLKREFVEEGCPSNACDGVECPFNLICVDIWRMYECRCPPGMALEPSGRCEDIDDCVNHGCLNGGKCIDGNNTYTCDCPPNHTGDFCQTAALVGAALSAGAWIAIAIAILVILVLVLLLIVWKTRRGNDSEKYILDVDVDDDIRENIVNYDEEGAGEEDQDAYDISRLSKPIDGSFDKSPLDRDGWPTKEHQAPLGRDPYGRDGEPPEVGDFIHQRLRDADDDPSAPPLDSVREYDYEGGGSDAGSLSSLNSGTTDSDQNFDYLNDWGPRFAKLADMYGAGQSAESD